jgi:hypothetical protein
MVYNICVYKWLKIYSVFKFILYSLKTKALRISLLIKLIKLYILS